MTQAMLIREANPQDADSIVRLIAEHAAADGEHSPLTPDYVAQYLTSR